jgi:hypothetical protein
MPEIRRNRFGYRAASYSRSPCRNGTAGSAVPSPNQRSVRAHGPITRLTPDSDKFTAQVQVVPDVLPHSFEEFRKTLK